MARPSTTAVLKRVRVLEAPAEAVPKRKELIATGVMLVPKGSAADWERIAIKQQAELIARSAQDRRDD
jgi:hypothetical protein